MKVKLIVIGKTKSKFLLDGENEYVKRLKHYCKFSELIIPDIKNGGKLSKKELKEKEGNLILESIKNSDYVILLDNKGLALTSIEFSELLNKKMVSSTNELVFIVGGAFGFSESVYKRANTKLSLSKMTFSHQMVRMIFKEQLYRAFTILKGEKYHHE
ncbi:MAG: 23S rRNA (pseudouridine(1915)-N(3))-methyltransferase RlmH [Flavobacteriales bacterium]|nr:23S rRNA (pseudouridine(1915)-N(3))-methyltransferase RlmH [Flavobacteriales bacterium]